MVLTSAVPLLPPNLGDTGGGGIQERLNSFAVYSSQFRFLIRMPALECCAVLVVYDPGAGNRDMGLRKATGHVSHCYLVSSFAI